MDATQNPEKENPMRYYDPLKTPIYARMVIERTPLGQVPIDPLREYLREYLEESECCSELFPARELDERGVCGRCAE